jgi:hypothetical protein
MVCEGVSPKPRKGNLVGKAQLTKKVPLGDATSRTISIGAGLSSN